LKSRKVPCVRQKQSNDGECPEEDDKSDHPNKSEAQPCPHESGKVNSYRGGYLHGVNQIEPLSTLQGTGQGP